MDSNEQDKEIQFLQKRVKLTQQENELLRKENQLQRQSLTQMKTTFTNIISTKRVKTADGRNNSVSERFQNEDALRQVLEMQRNRINQLEKDNEQYKLKYEKILFQDKSQPYSQTQVNDSTIKELYDLRKKNSELEQRIKEMISQHSKELTNYRSKIAQQDAQFMVSQSQGFSTPQLQQSQKLEPLNNGGYQILKQGIKKY
ncbi:unnamed protein product [Paramecium pentaurelia]|uniref:Uncharacterized protein n=1 Tax=Paramecium pentaurelia TaxID=43138 RepID=A0A8S1WHH1_9CILI|nr:unnamed protein product [Paramecium pentaurelia]